MRILLVDDHPLFLDGLKTLLTVRGLDVVGVARDGVDATELARSLKPEVILMDIEMPRLDGLGATRLIKAEQPDVKIVMLTMSASHDNLFEAIKSGASGYLLKADDTDRFFERLCGLMRGEAPLSGAFAGRVLDELVRLRADRESIEQAEKEAAPLTPRQIEVLTLVAQGLTYKEVAARLFLTEPTIKYHMGEIIERLHLENRRQVIEYARRMRLDAQ
ncbi:MAG TPA: response regulator transcription factor [Sedimentisphaerales bacterium]|jgi:two-component system NarL family response regulator|nr:response regulator transcription factor [Sedimentisphaerales bacterium]HNU31606.1 response regulator transcription factor [Sedimentisphaerales bacterium]